MRSPLFPFARFVANRLERDSDLDDVPVRGRRPLRVHDDVDVVVLALRLSEHTVRLHAEWVEEENVRAALVVEGVEVDADIIVVEDLVALRNRRADLVGFVVEAAERDEEGLAVVTEQNLGPLRRLDVVARLNLKEVLEDHSLAPNLVVEFAVDDGRRVESSKLGRRLGFLRDDRGGRRLVAFTRQDVSRRQRTQYAQQDRESPKSVRHGSLRRSSLPQP